jgi:dephospho-CoA kinase
LLVETQQQERFDRILVVDVPESVQLDRLMARDDIDASSAQRILDTQATRQQRLAVADDVVVNTGSVAETLAQVDKLHHTYSNLAD